MTVHSAYARSPELVDSCTSIVRRAPAAVARPMAARQNSRIEPSPRIGVTHLTDDAPAARLIVGRAVARGELQGGTEADLAALAHEVIEACLFRQLAIDAPLDEAFAVHVVDDLLMPVLTQAARRPRAGA